MGEITSVASLPATPLNKKHLALGIFDAKSARRGKKLKSARHKKPVTLPFTDI